MRGSGVVTSAMIIRHSTSIHAGAMVQPPPSTLSGRSKNAPLGSGLLHTSWCYRRSVGLCVSGSFPMASVLKSNATSIAMFSGNS
jgi:hypothetical protein